jgi:hypothetical protein
VGSNPIARSKFLQRLKGDARRRLLSIVVYGRNDNGYNLHKRAASASIAWP